jgi:hypothetical protein
MEVSFNRVNIGFWINPNNTFHHYFHQREEINLSVVKIINFNKILKALAQIKKFLVNVQLKYQLEFRTFILRLGIF